MKAPQMVGTAQRMWNRAKDSAFLRFFKKTPAKIDRHWRWWDFKLNRNYGGWMGRRLKLEGYSLISLFLPILALFFLVAGPVGGRRGVEAAIVYFTVGLILLFVWRWLSAKAQNGSLNRVLLSHIGISALLIAIVWLRAKPATSGVSQELYQHGLLALGTVLYVVMLPLAWCLAWLLFRRKGMLDVDYRATLCRTDLFRDPMPPETTYLIIFRSLFNVPLHYPLFLLFIPSVVVVFTPPDYRDGLPWLALISFLLAWMLLSFAGFHERLRAVTELMRRCLFVGGQFLVSIAIMILAVGRLAEFGYIETVVEGARSTIAGYILSSYAVFWLYEYWTNRLLTERLMRLLQKESDPAGIVTYEIDPSAREHERVPLERRLQIHGAARIMAIAGAPERPKFEPYERPALFDALASRHPDNPGLRKAADEIKHRIKFYFSFLNIFLVVIGVAAYCTLNDLEQKAQVEVKVDDPKGAVDLRQLIFGKDNEGDNTRDHVILLAASGGGTRAALYTASVLHGLAQLGELDNIVLTSGVSGGGAALAYYAAHEGELKWAPDSSAWTNYYVAVSQPFIQEVLDGATEWRVIEGMRLGHLLKESFQRSLDLNDTALGNCTNFALIFNTALAGHLWQNIDAHVPLSKWANENRRLTHSGCAGGRLIFTNIKQEKWFPAMDVEGSYRMKYAVVQSGNVPLAAAAALNANFPPVFSNAAVDDGTNRFWVTDGGAVDNRGIDALLFALRGALREQSKSGRPPKYPMIHIIVADASAASIDYQQDRGMGSKFGAPEKFATQLMEEMVVDLDRHYAELSGTKNLVRLHYLMMPNTLRMRGGLGTHWMLPQTVKLTDTSLRNPDEAKLKPQRLSGYTVRKMISELHQPTEIFPPDSSDTVDEVAMVQQWIKNDEHTSQWLTLIDELNRRPVEPTQIIQKPQTKY